MKTIILTATQASRVRGATAKGAALDPVALTDGTYALPVEVLTDPAHERLAAALSRLPQAEVPAEKYQWFADQEAAAQALAMQTTKR